MNKALVIDDSLMMREVFSKYLQQGGFNNVEKASSVAEAQSTLASYQPDLIILDVVMDGTSGFEFCHKLKKNRETCSIPVMICSSKTSQADLMLGDIVGADAYLPKTVAQAEFISKAQQLAQNPVHCKLLTGVTR
ncbi:response regulator [Waterburya agarophytonicola K14]|uniref:Response regulator n=1 Tax=Waterburya agarophytonicola KI4 TaxID=2874699 RepID=A0A964BLI8_9CYAN|nr:response regulator [Waterburya agarophytonicola]MCC0175590.1 response regulator [Waterburya agarophytonicola KI4]